MDDVKLRAVNVGIAHCAPLERTAPSCSGHVQPSSARSGTLQQPGSAQSTWLHVPGSSTSSASYAESVSPFVRQHAAQEVRRLVEELVRPLTLS